jgi:hypothetical protein
MPSRTSSIAERLTQFPISHSKNLSQDDRIFLKIIVDCFGCYNKDYVSNQQMSTPTRDSSTSAVLPEREILQAIRGIRFGVVEIVVHESRVTEIRQTRRVRLTASNPDMNSSDPTSGEL